MKRVIPIGGIVAIVIGIAVVFNILGPQENPDPNHTHADFAVWIDGRQLDFSGPEFMSEAYEEGEEGHVDEQPHTYLHLHDGNGNVIHRHKPGLSVLDFLKSLGVTIRETPDERICLTFPQLPDEVCEGDWHYFFLYTNDPQDGFASFLKDDYVFEDGDKILITNGSATTSEDVEAMRQQWFTLTDDACMYSKTCPWRGEPPTENCIADPSVPCVAP